MKKSLKKISMELMQYGHTFSDIKFRVFANHSPKVLANSIPKSGTNLLLRALYLFPSMHRKLHKTLNNRSGDVCKVINSIRNGEICSAHLKYEDNIDSALHDNDVKNIIIVRDPRDIAVSNCMYVTYKDTSHRLSDYFINELNDDDQRIMASIKGVSASKLKDGVESLSLAEHFEGYMKWQKDKNCLVIKFEDLVGANGGGTYEQQLLCVRKIVKHIELDASEKQLERVAKEIFNPVSRTFVKGQIGTWKKTMNAEHLDLVKSTMGNTLVELGYEEDFNW